MKNKKAFNNSVEEYDYKIDKLRASEEKIIKKFFKGKKVLDIGCGVGRTTINLINKGYDVIGIDYSEKLIKRAKEKYPKIDFRVMDACDLNFEDNLFDIVFFSNNGLDYAYPYKRRIKAIKEAKRILKKGGVFIYSSHKRFYIKFPVIRKYPFIRIHYLLFILSNIFFFNNYTYEHYNFGSLKTFCKNNSLNDSKRAGFKNVRRIDNKYNCYYICWK